MTLPVSHVERILGVLNGVVGDYLNRTDNGLATPMQLMHEGRALAITRDALRAAHPEATPRIAVLVHGLMGTEFNWTMPDGATYGSLLARDLGYTPFYLRYNTGRHISQNGEDLDRLLEQLVAEFPVAIDEIALVGHSMGGLVIRSACHAASENAESRESGDADEGRCWLPLVTRAFYLGTPHLGAPLERVGNAVSWLLDSIGNPYTRLVSQILDLRSSGIKDLRYANLRHEDWHGRDADELLTNRRHPVPLLPHIRHHLIAGAVSHDPRLAMLFGDAIVTVRSATGQARPADRSAPFPQEHVRIMAKFDHIRLSGEPEIYRQILAWISEDPPDDEGHGADDSADDHGRGD